LKSPIDTLKYFVTIERAARYKHKFSNVGNGLEIIGKPVIHGEGTISVGKNLSLRSLVHPIEIFAAKNASIRIGNNVDINQGVTISAQKQIDIGNYTMIGDQSSIYDTDWHGIDGNLPKVDPVVIGHHVWICAKVIVLKGVTIGDYSIIGAGSVITRNVAPNTKVAGCPAKFIGSTKSGYTYVPHHEKE
jgi:acetyltransferase-like isoleucine patch superfamily enzyme